MASTNSMVARLSVTGADQRLRLRWVGLNDEDVQLIKAAGPILAPHADSIVKQFYDISFAFPEFAAKIRDVGSQRSILEGAQKAYFLRILDGRFDEDYFENRLSIGARHAKLNIEPRWNVGNYGTYSALVFPILAKSLKGEKLAKTITALNKVFVLDVSLAIETYLSEGVLEKLVPFQVS